ncbi:TerC family protein [Pontibacter diazotrophicus]|uniref:TerC family protein n=1 Tax=Pontibacter diazotrophicus TaxID=1400979 RepID=A0A3D8LEI6_9BACT|nr:TerC family protein [Pontibacter diazotrophicus]RDV15716.1 TerC family protein [Pontibacter diazotrophicus]
MNNILFWILFNAFVLLLLGLDLFVFHRKEHEVKIKEALLWSLFWIMLSLGFNAVIYYWQGPGPALEFLTGYLIEKSLSVDNLFVFIMIFSYFKVPLKFQHKILFWGIIGALVLRGIFILVGVALIAKFHFIIYILGAFLIFTGVKMLFSHGAEELHPEDNPLVRWVSKHMRISKTPDGGKFFTKQNGKLYATPLFLVLIMVESTDVVFAADSIPAILAISKDPFIVYTSNVFALLGLRALYFALAGIMQLFHYLHYGLSAILVFIGAKLLLSDIVEIDMRYALLVVGAILAISVIASLMYPKPEEELPEPPIKE